MIIDIIENIVIIDNNVKIKVCLQIAEGFYENYIYRSNT